MTATDGNSRFPRLDYFGSLPVFCNIDWEKDACLCEAPISGLFQDFSLRAISLSARPFPLSLTTAAGRTCRLAAKHRMA